MNLKDIIQWVKALDKIAGGPRFDFQRILGGIKRGFVDAKRGQLGKVQQNDA